jgi:hypothetical protein
MRIPAKNPLSPLAALLAAVLLAVCADPRPSPVVPEGDGFTVIRQGPGGDGTGNPLADGDDDYWCDDEEDCYEKCPEVEFDGGTVGCSCTELGTGWYCTVKQYGPGEHPWEGEVGSGCGGGGIDPGDPLASCPSPPVVINCTGGSTERGDEVTCDARSSKYDTVPGVRYEWRANGNYYAGVGREFRSWSGVATRDATVSVKLQVPGGPSSAMSRHEVKVSPRWWPQLNEQHAGFEYTDDIPGHPNAYGNFQWAHALDLEVIPGGGPWEGSYMVGGFAPWIGLVKIQIHNDFRNDGPPYPHADSTTCGAEGMPYSAGMWTVNKECGTSGRLSVFHYLVRGHELMHQTSLNECIRTINPRLETIEGLVGNQEKVTDELRTLYGVNASKLKDAAETDQSDQESDELWDYRGPWRWTFGKVKGKDHYGRRGCT